MSAEPRPDPPSPRSQHRREMFDPRTALLVIDMQNFFIEPHQGHPEPEAEQVLRHVNALVSRAVVSGSRVVYTRDYGPADLPADDPLCDLHPDLHVRGLVVEKGPGRIGCFSAFLCIQHSGSGPGCGGLGELHGVLQGASAERLVLCGLTADVCVAATAQDARRLGYEVTIPLWATAFVHAHPHGEGAALEDLARGGVTIYTW